MSKSWDDAVFQGLVLTAMIVLILLANWLLSFVPWWLIIIIGLVFEKLQTLISDKDLKEILLTYTCLGYICSAVYYLTHSEWYYFTAIIIVLGETALLKFFEGDYESKEKLIYLVSGCIAGLTLAIYYIISYPWISVSIIGGIIIFIVALIFFKDYAVWIIGALVIGGITTLIVYLFYLYTFWMIIITTIIIIILILICLVAADQQGIAVIIVVLAVIGGIAYLFALITWIMIGLVVLIVSFIVLIVVFDSQQQREFITAIYGLSIIVTAIVVLFVYFPWIMLIIVGVIILYVGIFICVGERNFGNVIGFTIFSGVVALYIWLWTVFPLILCSSTILAIFQIITARASGETFTTQLIATSLFMISCLYYYLFMLYTDEMVLVSIIIACVGSFSYKYQNKIQNILIFAGIISVIGGLITLIILLYLWIPYVSLIATIVIVYGIFCLAQWENKQFIAGVTLAIGGLSLFVYLYTMYYLIMTMIILGLIYFYCLLNENSSEITVQLTPFIVLIIGSYYFFDTYKLETIFIIFLTLSSRIVYSLLWRYQMKQNVEIHDAYCYVKQGYFSEKISYKDDCPSLDEIKSLQKFYYKFHPHPESKYIEQTFTNIRYRRKDIYLYSKDGNIVVPSKIEEDDEQQDPPRGYPLPLGRRIRQGTGKGFKGSLAQWAQPYIYQPSSSKDTTRSNSPGIEQPETIGLEAQNSTLFEQTIRQALSGPNAKEQQEVTMHLKEEEEDVAEVVVKELQDFQVVNNPNQSQDTHFTSNVEVKPSNIEEIKEEQN